MEKSGFKRTATSVAVLLAVLAPPLLLLPVEIHSANLYDFQAALADLLPGLAALFAALLIVGTLVMIPVPQRGFRVLVALLLAIAFIVWIQGQFLAWDYGVFDGRTIDWRAHPMRDLFDLLLLLLIPAGAVLARRWLLRNAITIASALILIQAVPAVWSVWKTPPIPDIHRFGFDETHKFRFSTDRNVIILVLDAFQSDVFQEILDNEPEWSGVFDGFTYFRNAVAGYGKTYPTFALMLTGQWYENDTPIQDFIERSFTRHSVTTRLVRDGWRVDLFPHIKRVIHPSPAVASNVVPLIEPELIAEETGKLADLGLFRVTPHRLKRHWINDYQWRLATVFARNSERISSAEPPRDEGPPAAQRHPHAAARFVHELEARARADLSPPAFKLFHLMIPHAPFNLDRSLRLSDLPGGNEGFVRQSYTALEVVKRLLAELDEIGIYDDTLLFVVSDHGGGEHRPHVYLEGINGIPAEDTVASNDVPIRQLSSGLPLVLVKPFESRGGLEISDAPVSLADIAHTIAESLGVENSYPERNLFDVAIDEFRPRRYLHYRFTGWSRVYLPEMIEYRVEGFSWLREHWQPTGRIFAPGGDSMDRSRYRRIVSRLSVHFRPGSPFIDSLVEGWSEPQRNGMVWSNRERARIEFALDENSAGSVKARFNFLPFTAEGAIESQRIELEVNNKLKHTWIADRRGWYEVDIPESVIRDRGSLVFEFHFPDAASPYDYGYSIDRRLLGIALYTIQIRLNRP